MPLYSNSILFELFLLADVLLRGPRLSGKRAQRLAGGERTSSSDVVATSAPR
jgi:hypothetical protein